MSSAFQEVRERAVTIPLDGILLRGDLAVPADARGIVVFAHGSGSGRMSPRNRAVASELQRSGYATLLLDLLTLEEERVDAETRHLRFDIPLLAARLMAATHWVQRDARTHTLPVGYFGASTGAAAALVAAARMPDVVRAVVSRGGRPDMAGELLPVVRAPTLLLVGTRDEDVLELNRDALGRMRAVKALITVPNATHLFEEPGAMAEVTRHACAWFDRHLAQHAPEAARV